MSAALAVAVRGLPRGLRFVALRNPPLRCHCLAKLSTWNEGNRLAPMTRAKSVQAGHAVRLFHTTQSLSKKAKAGKAKDEEPVTEAPSFDTDEYSELMDKAVNVLKKDFDKLRTGQVSAGMLDHVKVEAYGSHVPLSQVGQVLLRDPKTLVINVFDQTTVKAVEAAVRDCGMNLNPIAESDIIRVPIPKMTKEFRESMVKMCKDMGENAKLSIRRARQKAMDAIKKVSKSMGKDDVKALEKQIQDLHDKHVRAVDDLVQRKMKAIMQ